MSIAARYRQQIETGALKPGDQLPSFAEVRSELGIGQSTLERAHELLERDLLIQREPGRGVFVAQRSAKPRTGIIGLSGIDAGRGHHPYFSRLVEGVRQAAQDAGVEILLLHEDVPLEEGKVDGILLYSHAPDVALRRLPPCMPCVSLLRGARGISSLTVNEYEGIAVAMRHLIEQGHTKIAYLCALDDNPVMQQRVQAYRDTLMAAGIEARAEWLRHLPDFRMLKEVYREFLGWGFECMNAWLDQNWAELGCTALLAQNDDTAVGVARAFHARGWSIPDQVSLIGYDDTLTAELMHPPLTTVHVPLRDIGAKAMELLLHEIEKGVGAAASAPSIVFNPTLQVRASTSPNKR
ncbi:MAG TPA: GntR family transcriptional regulator [Abditibacteriaceae bacterium]